MNRRRQTMLAVVGTMGAAAVVGGLAGPAQAGTAAPTRTVAATTTPTAVLGQVVHLKATVKPVLGSGLPTGTVTFRDGATALGTATLVLANGVEVGKVDTAALAIGDHAVSASYSGGASWAASTSLSVTVVVGQDASTTTVGPVAVLGVPGKYNLDAKVKVDKPGNGTPTGVVTFVIDGGPAQAVALGTGGRCHLAVKFVVGTKHTVVASYGGDAATGSSSGSVSFTA
jgi:large repetitive protein